MREFWHYHAPCGSATSTSAATRCTPRSATAQAKVACQLISLDEKQFQSALRQKALANGLGDSARVRYPGGKAILAQGQAGALMYVVLEGRVAISLHGEVVERVGPGGVFGEIGPGGPVGASACPCSGQWPSACARWPPRST